MEYIARVALQFWQAIRVWPHSEIFTGRRPVKMLVGELPKPAELLDTLVCPPSSRQRNNLHFMREIFCSRPV